MKKRQKRRLFKHFKLSERLEIKILLDKNYNQKEIAQVLEVNPSSISREIRLGKGQSKTYCPHRANHHSRARRSHSKYRGMKLEDNPKLRETVITALTNCQSPDAIAGRLGNIGKDAIYTWLYSVFGQRYSNLLCTKRQKQKKQKKKTKREMIPWRISIDLRPYEGIHGEFDTFVNKKKYKNTVSVATVTEPESMLMQNRKIPNLKSKVMTRAINSMVSLINLDDLTGDNGIENRDHRNYTLPAYFANPHAPWQKPHVEVNIGLLRRWFVPKDRNLGTIDQRELDKYTDVINRKWRKSLGYMNSYEMALSCGTIYSIPSVVSMEIIR
jgi:transposase, IS30 family